MEKLKLGAIISIIGGVLLIIGSFGPWAGINLGILGSVSVSGISGDGMITLLLGLAFAVTGGLALKFKPKALGITTIVLAGLAGLTVLVDMMSIGRIAGSELAGGLVQLQWGIYLALIAAIAGVVGGAIITMNSFKR